MDIKKLKQRLIAGTGVTLLGSGATGLFSLFLTLVLIKMLDVGQFGLMSAAQSTLALTAGLLDVRFGEALTKFGADFLAKGRQGKAMGLIVATYVVDIGLAVLMFLVLFAPASLIADYAYRKPELTPLIRIVAFLALAQCTTSASLAVLRTFNRFTAITGAMTFAGISRFVLPVLCCFGFNRDIRYVLLGFIAAALASTVVLVVLALGTIRAELPGVRAESVWPDLRYIVPFTLQTLLGVIFKNLSRGSLAIAIVTRYRPEEEIAYLKLGLGIGGMLSVVPSAVGFVVFPSFAELWAKGERKMLLRVISKLSKLLALGLTVGGILNVAAAPPFIHVWKPAFMPAMPVVYWLVAATVVDGICCWIRPAALSLGEPWISTLVNFVRMVALVGLGVLLVPTMGFVGIGVATLALSVSSIALGAFLVVRSILSEQRHDELAKQTG